MHMDRRGPKNRRLGVIKARLLRDLNNYVERYAT